MRLPTTRRPRRVTLYRKPGCHLCDEARALLSTLERRFPHTVREIDIRSDPALARRYGLRIPVITVDDGPEIDAPLSESRLREALRGRH